MYFDAHCHLQFDAYDADREAVIARMRDGGVGGVVVGVDAASSRAAVELARRHKHLWAAVGLHPNRAHEGFDAKAYRALAAEKKVVAIGECGLDYFRPVELTEEVKRAQGSALRAQIALAAEFDLPLIIHARPSKGAMDAYRDLIVILAEEKKKFPDLRGDVHFFVGGLAEMRALVALGFTISYTAVVTFARDYDAVIRAAPLGSLLAETDAPFVAPAARRGERNDPLAVVEVARKIAEIRAEEPERVRAALLENARRLFGL